MGLRFGVYPMSSLVGRVSSMPVPPPPHLSFPLLAHLSELEIFPAEDVLAAQYELAKGTNMVDYAASLFEQLHPGDEPPAGTTHML